MTESLRKPIRLWPGVVAGVLAFLLWFIVPGLLPDLALYAIFGGLACALLVVVWWLFFSRAPWPERLGALVLAVAAVLVVRLLVHPSIAGGMMGLMLPIYAVPVLGLAIVGSAVASRRMSTPSRRATMAAAILATCAVFVLLRTDGILGFRSQLQWRWTPTPEQRLLAQTANEKDPVAPPAPLPSPAIEKPAAAPSAPAVAPADIPAEWPGFRGPARDSIVPHARIATDWSTSPPREIWRRPIGPGWSSFAVQGRFVYTQEQRGEDEIVAAYDLTTGAPLWRHRDPARFWESNAGAGPRGTPAIGRGRIYALGATGIVNALDARTGAVIWSRNAATDTGAPLPGWGFAGSPLIVGDVVIVATGGRLAAYDAANGAPRWTAQTGGAGYSSPQLATIDGVDQVLLLNTSGAAGVAPADGAVLWTHEWRSDGIVQPAVMAGHEILVGSGSGGAEVGMRRLEIMHASGAAPATGWSVVERWTSNGLKPYFNDFVVHEGHAFGFDGSILSCIDLADGKRKWKGGRYGQGQMIVLPDQDVLIVLSEEGELALVSATPDEFKELARFKALEGKTWNHPVLIGDILLVRNSEEMAAFRVPIASR
jgi:outer membrane protein assembly factor BamB